MNYFYAVNGQQTGPVSEEQLRGMVTSGALPADTLIWREGMPQWQAFSTALGGVEGVPPTAAVQCNVCKQTFPADQTIQYGSVNVCAGCKPTFLQGLREGATVTGTLELAGLGARVGAKILDMIILYGLQTLLNFTVFAGLNSAVQGAAGGGPANLSSALGAMAALTLVGFIIHFAYQTLFLHWKGQTPGKMALKIKVVTPEGAPLGWGKSLGRPLAEILSGCILYIGYIIAFFDDEKRALHDRLAGTRVVKAN
jgi:uncharacterized RDD family membrane protein YckC